MQVRWVDQTQYPEDTIESFVGQSSMGLLCPPATLETENLGTQVVHTHTHTYIHICIYEWILGVRAWSVGFGAESCRCFTGLVWRLESKKISGFWHSGLAWRAIGPSPQSTFL